MSTEYVGEFTKALNYARGLLKQIEFTMALEQVNEILKARPGDVRILFLKGIVQRRLGNHEDSCNLLGKVVRKAPELAAAQQELGLVLFALRQIDAAKVHLQRAVALDKNLAASWNMLGEIYAVEGNEE